MVGEATAGGEHTLYKSKDGALASTGACGLGWCRLLSLNPSLFRFRAVPLPEHASLVHASYYHNLAVGRTSGSLYSWGCGTFTEGGLDGVIPALGQGRNAEDIGGLPKVVDIPMKSGEFIKDITGGAYHSAVLMNTGRIATFPIQQYSFQSRGNKTSQVDFDFGVFATILYTDCLSATSDRRLEENLSTQLPRKLRIQSFVTKL